MTNEGEGEWCGMAGEGRADRPFRHLQRPGEACLMMMRMMMMVIDDCSESALSAL